MDGALGRVLDLALPDHRLALASGHPGELPVEPVRELVDGRLVLVALEAGREHDLHDEDLVIVEQRLVAALIRGRDPAEQDARDQADERDPLRRHWVLPGMVPATT